MNSTALYLFSTVTIFIFFAAAAIFDLHGPRSDSEHDLQSEPKRAYEGRTHACADTEFPCFITTARPADRPPLPEHLRHIYFKKYLYRDISRDIPI